jgi:hypothetical protein
MVWKRADEVTALGLLLDRTYAEVAALGERPRECDREFLVGLLDLWAGRLQAAVAAAAAPLRTRRRAARAVWHSLGHRAGPAQHAWLRDQVTGFGLDAEELLGPARAPGRPGRAAPGHALPAPAPLTAESIALLLSDYDLAGGDVEAVRLEVDGTDPPRLRGYLALSAGGRRYTETPGPRPELQFRCRDVATFDFPHAGRGEARLTGQPVVTVTGDGVGEVVVPAAETAVRLTGGQFSYYPDDSLWHESAAARAAASTSAPSPQLPVPAAAPTHSTAATPAHSASPAPAAVTATATHPAGLVEAPTAPGPPWLPGSPGAADLPTARDWPPGPLGVLARLQSVILVQAGTARHPEKLRRWQFAAAGTLCAGLGSETIRIAASLGPESWRDRAATRRLDALIMSSEGLSRTLLQDAARRADFEVAGPDGPPPPAPTRVTVGTAARLLADDRLDFAGARLRFVDFAADRRPGHADQTVIHLDARRDGRDTIVVITLSEPLGRAPLTVTPAGLTLTGRPRISADADEVAVTIPLPGVDWTLRAGAATWYAD